MNTPKRQIANSTKQIAGNIAIAISMFPWLGPQSFQIESQPWPVAACALYLLISCSTIKIPKHIYIGLLIIIPGYICSLLLTKYPISFLSIRAAYNYAGFLCMYIAFYNYIKNYSFPAKIVKYSAYIWMAGAILESYAPNLMHAISSNRTSEDRGLTSFAPEPTFFGAFIFFTAWLIFAAEDHSIKRERFFLGTMIGSIIFLSQSTMIIAFLAVGYLGYLGYVVTSKKTRKILPLQLAIISMATISGTILIQANDTNSRALNISKTYIESKNLFQIVESDASINSRLQHIIFSAHGAILNNGLPTGFDNFPQHEDRLKNFYNNYFWYSTGATKVMSWIGDYIFHLGLLGAIYLIILFRSINDNTRESMFRSAFLLLTLLTAIPLALPQIPFLFATLHHNKIRLKKPNSKEQ